MLWVPLGFYIVGASSSVNNCPFEDFECLSTDNTNPVRMTKQIVMSARLLHAFKNMITISDVQRTKGMKKEKKFEGLKRSNDALYRK